MSPASTAGGCPVHKAGWPAISGIASISRGGHSGVERAAVKGPASARALRAGLVLEKSILGGAPRRDQGMNGEQQQRMSAEVDTSTGDEEPQRRSLERCRLQGCDRTLAAAFDRILPSAPKGGGSPWARRRRWRDAPVGLDL